VSKDEPKPDFRIYDDGSLLKDAVLQDIIQITVDEPLNEAAVATVRLRDVGGCNSDGKKLKIGSELKIEMGYMGGSLKEVFCGEITAWRGAFPRRGTNTLLVVAQDRFHRLRRNRRQKTYLETKDSDIASQVCSAAGLSADAEATPIKHDSVLQWNQTDADFLLERASLYGYEVYVDGKKVKFQKPKLDAGAAAKIKWHEQLRNFTTVISLSQQQKELKSTAWDMVKKERLEFVAKKGDERNLMTGTIPGADAVKDVIKEPTWSTTTPAKTPEEIETYAKALFTTRAERFLRGQGTAQGDPAIRRGTVVELEGIGDFLSGPFYCWRVMHSLLAGKGYTTTFCVLRTAVKRPSAAPSSQSQSPAKEETKTEAVMDPEYEATGISPALDAPKAGLTPKVEPKDKGAKADIN
jgi:Bacteriophage probable baseplate hub protein